MKNQDHPFPPFGDGKNGVFRLWCEFIIESGRWVVLFLIFSPRMLSPDENNQSGWFPKIIYVDEDNDHLFIDVFIVS